MRSHADRQPAAQIKLPRLQFVWTRAAVPTAKWHASVLGLSYRETPRRLHIYAGVRNLLLGGATIALAVYFGGAAVLAYTWGRNPYNQITYADLVLPTRWHELRQKRGQGQVDEGIHEMRAGHFSTGLMLLGGGVARKPTAIQGRMALAQAFVNLGYLHRGLQLLEDGLAYGPPPKVYRESLFRLCAYLEDHERTLALAEKISAMLPPNDTSAQRWLLNQRLAALESLHRYDEIEQLRAAHKESPSFALEATWARVQAARGRPEDALREIARDPGRFGLPVDRCQLQLTLAVAAHDLPAARAAIDAWMREEPTKPEPRVQEIAALVQLGETAEARAQLRLFFSHYATERAAVILLLKKMSGLADVSWLQAAHQEALESGAFSPDAQILYVQGLITAGKIPEALTEFNLVTARIAQAKINDGGWSEGTRRLLEVIVSDSPSSRSLFLDFFRSHRLTPEAYRFALKSLRRADSQEVAGELAVIAVNRFPALAETTNPTALAVAAKPDDAGPGLRTELEARAELRRLDADLKAGNLPAAFTRLKTVERGKFGALQAELLQRRIQLQGAGHEQADLSAALQLYLSSPAVSQEWLHELAQQWSANGRADSAATLAKETLARFPQARWAADLLHLPAAGTGTVALAPVVFRNEAEARAELRKADGELDAGKATDAGARIKRIERAGFVALQPELLLRRIRVHGELGEQTELSAAAGYYLSGATVDLTTLHKFAEHWDNERQRDSALSLLREVLAKYPEARWATELRKKIEGNLMVAPEKIETGKR